jgi:ubiquinone/menaquinone biosynthesis C-methylase UbiE
MKKTPYSDPTMAAVYNRVATPLQFAPPAKDLVEMLQLQIGDTVLDVGTGTGAVALAAMPALGSTGFVVGVDAAIEMLAFARRSAGYPVAVAQIPELPYRDRTFDVVTASFVITHVPDYGRGLSELVRICRIGGRVGMTAWGSLPNPGAQLWSDIASQYVPRKQLDNAFRAQIPWDEWFSQPANIRQALEDAGMATVTIQTRQYHVRMSSTDFLSAREASVQGIVLRQELNDDGWDQFRHRVRDAFRNRFGESVEYDRDVHFGTGVRSAC